MESVNGSYINKLILSKMRKLKKINLSSLSKDELEKRELNNLLGGENCCICSCWAEHQGGSSTASSGGGNNAIGSNWQSGYGSGSFSGH